MGIFPYTCEICGGGYNRCGNQSNQGDQSTCESGCPGGQMCYEENVAIELINGETFYGTYDGYGTVSCDNAKNMIFVPKEFDEFIPHWNLNKKKKIQLVSIYCRSCYDKRYS